MIDRVISKPLVGVKTKDNMTEQAQSSPPSEEKKEVIETNLAKQRRMYEKQLEQERLARQQAEERLASLEAAANARKPLSDDGDDEEDDEPYIDRKKLRRELSKFRSDVEQTIEQKATAKAAALIEQERRTGYLEKNSDFDQVMNPDTIEKFAQKHPKLAENILRMPDGFDRQKLVYENIKALGIDKPETKQPSIQDKIEANRRSPYYQPSGVGAAPYASVGDFSDSGQKNAYEKMQELKKRLRI